MNRCVVPLALVLMLSFLLAVPAIAAAGPVSSISVQRSGTIVLFSGVAADDVAAVAVLLYDPSGSLIRMGSVEVQPDGSFAGSYEVDLSKSGTYSVRASNYDGGPFTSASFVVPATGGSPGGSGGSWHGSDESGSPSSNRGVTWVRTSSEGTEDDPLVDSAGDDDGEAPEYQPDLDQQTGVPASGGAEQQQSVDEDQGGSSTWLAVLGVLGGGIVAGALLRLVALRQAKRG